MAFNHYAKIKRILSEFNLEDWYIVKYNEKTQTKAFDGTLNYYDCYYRVFHKKDDKPIPYCKFQQLDKLSSILKMDLMELEEKIKTF